MMEFAFLAVFVLGAILGVGIGWSVAKTNEIWIPTGRKP